MNPNAHFSGGVKCKPPTVAHQKKNIIYSRKIAQLFHNKYILQKSLKVTKTWVKGCSHYNDNKNIY